VLDHESLDGAIDRQRADERVAGERPAPDSLRLDASVQRIAGRCDLPDQACAILYIG